MVGIERFKELGVALLGFLPLITLSNGLLIRLPFNDLTPATKVPQEVDIGILRLSLFTLPCLADSMLDCIGSCRDQVDLVTAEDR